jgi:class 3 adenylate cyclase
MQRQLEVKELDNEIYRLKNVELKNSHDEIQRRNEIIESERKKSEALLLNILPEETALELMQTGKALSRKYEMVTVMFTDFVGFTQVAEKMQPEELVQQIDAYFRKFDDITHRFGVEKIKTIGDAYMCAGGLSVTNKTSPADVVRAALAIQRSAQEMVNGQFSMRIGIHTGSVVAGVVGKHKFQYDIWGDTVNIAARMEQSALPGTINISSATYELTKDAFVCAHRGKVEAKNKGAMDMYIVSGEGNAITAR